MNNSIDSANPVRSSGENTQFIMPIWSEDDFEEIQEEAPWEIFSSEIDNWAAINIHSTDL